jgi:hypothetical protein
VSFSPSLFPFLILCLFYFISASKGLSKTPNFAFFICHTRTHPHSKEVILVDQNNPVNPITLLKNHICVNGIPKDGLLFSFRESGHLTVMDKTFFLQCCNDIWQPLGHPHLTGHSFQIGGTTHRRYPPRSGQGHQLMVFRVLEILEVPQRHSPSLH